MIFGIGVDIVKIDRFENNHFIKHVFTEREREYFSKKNTQTIAGIFAAKEAVAKAMGTGFSGFFPIDIEILHKESGKPFVVLHNKAKKTMRRLLKRPHRFSYARKLLSQFPSPMGATPPNPLASVGKAHFRSAA
ncbi:MAG: holo-ACP synthase, partial [Defluviitaleaceae bacterium]|nr:holo-ACP synthase [Defluviitaleaceae bacterium]